MEESGTGACGAGLCEIENRNFVAASLAEGCEFVHLGVLLCVGTFVY